MKCTMFFFSQVQQFDVNSVLLLLSHHRADILHIVYPYSTIYIVAMVILSGLKPQTF